MAVQAGTGPACVKAVYSPRQLNTSAKLRPIAFTATRACMRVWGGGQRRSPRWLSGLLAVKRGRQMSKCMWEVGPLAGQAGQANVKTDSLHSK